MTEAVQQYYIANPTAPAPELTLVLKHGETFCVFNHYGDIDVGAQSDEGLYHRGTRHLSRLALLVAGGRPLLLSSSVRRDNLIASIDLTNPDIHDGHRVVLPRGTLHIYRAKLIRDGVWYEQLRVHNFGPEQIALPLSLVCGADYADIFEVRGQQRARRGVLQLPRSTGDRRLELAYVGLDGVLRRTLVESSAPAHVTGGTIEWIAGLASGEARVYEFMVVCESGRGEPPASRARYGEACSRRERELEQTRRGMAAVSSSDSQFDAWIERSAADLSMLLSSTPQGPYPFAGVPWFDTPFGRDGLITALQCLWLSPGIARGVLAFLAAHQATELEPARDAEPGKILHEMRHGEMAALGEIPFGRYYGSVDATPLFVLLAARYLDATGDLDFVHLLWPNVERALAWIDGYGDVDQDGFVEYARRTPSGLAQQGWKDSHDSVFHADGWLAEGPIALCEVQGYVYAAKRGAARIAAALGRPDAAARLETEAAALQQRFERSFWSEEIGTYALALDGRKQPCRVRTSNPGHCLYTRIVTDADRACRLGAAFAEEPYFSGWGVRTVAAGEVRYNPMSYHNGSVWPHDNALLAAGASRYGSRQLALKLLAAQFDACTFFTSNRLPELFCGFHRRPGKAPTSYPVACSPQAWASGAAFMLLEACLGLSVDAQLGRLILQAPELPDFLDYLRLVNVRVGRGAVDVVLRRRALELEIEVERRTGGADVELRR